MKPMNMSTSITGKMLPFCCIIWFHCLHIYVKPATYLSTKNDERVNIGIIQFVSLFNNHKHLDKGSFAKLEGRGCLVRCFLAN